MRTRSPTSLVLVREQMRRGARLDLRRGDATEYRMVSALMRGHDFFEGVRAAVIDKDGAPAWKPASPGRRRPAVDRRRLRADRRCPNRDFEDRPSR